MDTEDSMRYAQAMAPSKLDEPRLGCIDAELQKLETILELLANPKAQEIGQGILRTARKGIPLTMKQRHWIQTAYEWTKQ